MLRTRMVLTFSMCVMLVGSVIAATGVVTIARSVHAATTERWDGADRYATSVRISQEAFPTGADVVFLATGQSFPDALAAGPAAAALGSPILLSATNQLPSAVSAELQRLDPSVVYVLGGPAAISPSVEAQVDTVINGETIRIAGDNRYATAAAVAELAFPTADIVYIAVGTGFADALSAGAPGGILRRPVILTGSSSLPKPSSEQIIRLANPDVIVLGGTSVVSGAVLAQLESLTTGTVRRVDGANRHETSVAVSADSFVTADTVFLATGSAFPDALSAAPAAKNLGGPILLTRPTCAPDEVIAEVNRLGADRVIALGGTSAVSNAAANLTPCSGGLSAPASWQAAIDSGSIAQIRSWYVAHTGHDAEGACPDASTFETLVGVQNITKANTTLENVRIVGPVNVQATGFTLRCAIVDIGGYTYGVDLVNDSPSTGWTLEYVTFTNSKYLASKNPDSMANRPVHTNSAGTARYLKTLDGYGNGYSSVNASDQLWEYVFNDRVVKTPGSHNTGLNIRSFGASCASIDNITVRRSLLLDGTSAPLALYTDTCGTHSNLTFDQNIVDMSYASNAAYCLYRGTDRGNSPTLSNIRFTGNIFGQSTSAKCGNSGSHTGPRPTEWSGNRFLDGALIP